MNGLTKTGPKVVRFFLWKIQAAVCGNGKDIGSVWIVSRRVTAGNREVITCEKERDFLERLYYRFGYAKCTRS
ncbi:MAG: hypothetical protein ACAI35_14210, partial [Candidatus Methylacidiphilales bacterium]|nr:hypothetical protein [Candidatus Methylacidiphilales bacterium]